MSDQQRPQVREYVGLIWIAGQPGLRFRVDAQSLEEARALVVKQYGEGHVISIWNEDDAASARMLGETEV